MKTAKPLHEIIEEHRRYEKANEQLREELKKWKREARYDNLTGLLRRQTFDSLLSKLIDRAKRFKKPLTFLLADIDYFKMINDTYGHQKGDEVLQLVSNTLAGNLRDTDLLGRGFVGRYGGEEIAIVLPNTDPENALMVAERLRAKIEELDPISKKEGVKVTISIGVSAYNSQGDSTVEALYKSADKRLYKAKEEGRNRVKY